jgi:putative mRNA 3-end processing factor
MDCADIDFYMDKNKDPVDALIIEATYGDRDHPLRSMEEKRFVRKMSETVDNGGSVIVPVFALGRAQEIMLLIYENLKKINCPVYVDGMATDLNRIILNNPESIRTPGLLAKAMHSINPILSGRDRIKALNGQGVFITTSGMLTGGPVIEYLKHLHNNNVNSILLTGYQGAHTNGDLLLKQKQVYIDGWRTTIRCEAEQFDFSAHAGLSQLKKIAKSANPDTIIVQHGDMKAISNFAEWARALDFRVHMPAVGDMIRV